MKSAAQRRPEQEEDESMQSDRPVPGDPWPHDMVLHIADRDDDLLELLWVRHRYDLTPHLADGPPELLALEPVPATTESLRRDKKEWNQAWGDLWLAALQRRDATARNPIAAERLDRLDNDQIRALLHGPTWRTRFGVAAFDTTYEAWIERLHYRTESHTTPLDQQPERRSLPALTRAWRRGLTQLVTIPCTGDYTQTLSPTTLLLTETTREAPGRYTAALDRFAP